MPGFKVVKDYFDERYPNSTFPSMKGKESKDYAGETDIRVRTYDDDNTLYYEAVCGTEEDAERFHDWSSADSGTVYSKIKLPGKKEWENFIG